MRRAAQLNTHAYVDTPKIYVHIASLHKLAGTALILRLTKPWHGSGRAISADSAFALVSPQLLLVERMVCTSQD